MALPDPPQHPPIRDGLRSQLRAVDEQMRRIAAGMVQAVKAANDGTS